MPRGSIEEDVGQDAAVFVKAEHVNPYESWVGIEIGFDVVAGGETLQLVQRTPRNRLNHKLTRLARVNADQPNLELINMDFVQPQDTRKGVAVVDVNDPRPLLVGLYLEHLGGRVIVKAIAILNRRVGLTRTQTLEQFRKKRHWMDSL